MSLPYYKRFPRDFLEGTIGLSFEVKGAYAIVLDLIYMRDGRLSDDPRYIAGQLGCSVRKWTAIRAELLKVGKLSVADGIISNFRADYLTEESRKYQDKQAEIAGKPRKNSSLPQPKASQPEPEPEAKIIADIDASAPDWSARLHEATKAGGEGLDRTSTGLMHARDLRALCEPSTGEPCEWGEVLDAVRMSAARAKTRGKPLRSWSWVRDDALALRDKRLTAHLPKPEHRHERPSPSDKFDRRQANHAASDAGAFAAARQRFQP